MNSAEDFFEKVKSLYENTLQKGETFAPEMGEEIQKELERLIEERKKWCQK